MDVTKSVAEFRAACLTKPGLSGQVRSDCSDFPGSPVFPVAIDLDPRRRIARPTPLGEPESFSLLDCGSMFSSTPSKRQCSGDPTPIWWLVRAPFWGVEVIHFAHFVRHSSFQQLGMRSSSAISRNGSPLADPASPSPVQKGAVLALAGNFTRCKSPRHTLGARRGSLVRRWTE